MVADLSADLRRELEAIFRALASELRRAAPFYVVLDDAGHRVRLEGDTIAVPLRYEVHWRRFRTIPTELVREAAYDAFRAQRPMPDDADSQAFAEKFARDQLLWSD